MRAEARRLVRAHVDAHVVRQLVMPQSHKRRRIEDNDTEPDDSACIFIHDRQFKKLAGGKIYANKSELSHELLFKYFSTKEVKSSKVAVQKLDGPTIELTMDITIRRTAKYLKEAIEQRKGTSRRLQELFLLDDSNGEERGMRRECW